MNGWTRHAISEWVGDDVILALDAQAERVALPAWLRARAIRWASAWPPPAPRIANA
jgi:hypothetical protein